MSDLTKEAVDRVAELGKNSTSFTIINVTKPSGADGLPSSIPIGFDHKGISAIDLRPFVEKWREYPERKTGTAQVTTLQSFVDLVIRHKTEHSVIFAKTNWPDPSLVAVIDYHEVDNGKPAFGKHKILYNFPVTEEFSGWIDNDGEVMAQGDFAAFIEEHAAELATPTDEEERELGQLFQTRFATPADMFALSRGLEIRVNHVVKNAVRLASGESEVVFTEEHIGGNGEKLVIPGLFMVQVAVFLDGGPMRLVARLRYRKQGSALVWFYQLYRWKERLNDRVTADLAYAAVHTELPAYQGAPEA